MKKEHQSEFTFNLSTPVEYAVNGTTERIKYITLRAPSRKEAKYTSFLRAALYNGVKESQLFLFKLTAATENMAAVQDQVDQAVEENKKREKRNDNNQDDDGESPISAKDVMNSLLSGSAPIHECVESFSRLVSKVVTIEDTDIAFSQVHFDKLTQEEAEEVMAEYMAFFIAPSIRNIMSGNA